jgi:hypothetical protein
MRLVRLIIECVIENYSVVILFVRNGLKLVKLIRVCVSETYSGVIFIVTNGLKLGDIS